MIDLQRPLVRAPDFAPGLWINSTPLSIQGLRGRVVLVDIWDFTCINCIRTLPYLIEWHRRYTGLGLTIVGVHSPEFEFAKDSRQVSAAAQRFGISYPVVLDNDHKTWTRYANRYWPAQYLIDANGYIRYSHHGEGGYEQTELAIQSLLHDLDSNAPLPDPMPPVRLEDAPGAVSFRITPELYAGVSRGALGNPDAYVPGVTMFYTEPDERLTGVFYAVGPWKAERDHLASGGGNSSVLLPYHAASVNVVAAPSGDPVALLIDDAPPATIILTQNGRPLRSIESGDDVTFDAQGHSVVIVDAPRLYNLVKNPTFVEAELRLAPNRSGVAIYAFTFTSCVVPDNDQLTPELSLCVHFFSGCPTVGSSAASPAGLALPAGRQCASSPVKRSTTRSA